MYYRIKNIRFYCVILPFLVFANENALLKMDSDLRMLVRQSQLTKSSRIQFDEVGQPWVYILAEGNCQKAISQSGGKIYTDLGNLVSAYVPLYQLENIFRSFPKWWYPNRESI